MRLSVITDEVSQDLKVALDFAARHGLQGVELRSVAGRGPFEWDDADWRAIRGALQSANLPACAFSAPLFKCAIDDGPTRARQMARLPIAMERAAEVGATIIRGFAFWREAGELPINRIVDAYGPVAELAEQFGVTIALEVEPSVYTVSAASLRAVLQAIAHPRVRAVWDGANLLYDRAGERPADGYEILKDW
ncbi:MAG: sugar phosphate isomerase/epimerase, partial [Clostridiales bacterium]|nr:sugar phosphate isomerase/epimerase [Clostridiales bacterium]